MCLIRLKAYHENSPRDSKLISHSRVLKSLAHLFVVLSFSVCLVGWGFFFIVYFLQKHKKEYSVPSIYMLSHIFWLFFNPYLYSVQINFEVIFAFCTES